MSNTLINQAMKRLLTLGLMLASAFALTNCAEQLDTPDQEKDIIVDVTDHEYGAGDPYEIYVDEVDTKTNYTSDGKTVWSNGDKILVYSKPAGSADGYICHQQYEYCTLSDGRKGFKGYLGGTLSNKNDWYFIYTDSSSASTSAEGTVSIGAGAIQQDPSEDPLMYVMSSSNCPLWGMDNRVDKNDRPRFKMKYLYSVVAVEIINQGAGENIAIRDIELKANEGIVGNFKVNIGGEMPIYKSESGTSTTTSIALSSPKVIEYGKSATFYFAVKPFTVAKNGSLTIKVNGSARTVSIPDGVQLQSGKVTTVKVPVKDYYSIHTYDSDALTLTSKGRLSGDQAEKILNISGGTSMTINGKDNVTAYVVGSTSEAGNLIIRGFAKEILDAMPIGFYASRYNDNPTAMTIDYVNVWLPEYNGLISKDYSNLKGRKSLKSKFGLVTGLLRWDVTENGITRGLITGTLGIDANTITFKGIVSNGYFDASNVVMLDDNPVHKDVSEDKVEAYIKKFGAEATLQGLKDILNAEFSGSTIAWTDEAKKTGQAIYNKIKSVVARKVGDSLAGTAMSTIGFGNYEALMYQLRDMKFELCIKTYPYAEKYTAAEATGQLQPIVFWGFDANAGE